MIRILTSIACVGYTGYCIYYKATPPIEFNLYGFALYAVLAGLLPDTFQMGVSKPFCIIDFLLVPIAVVTGLWYLTSFLVASIIVSLIKGIMLAMCIMHMGFTLDKYILPSKGKK